MSEKICVPKRFQGPTDIVNGGYLSGLLGEILAGPSKVSLRAPWPVDVELDLVRDEDSVRVEHDGALIAAAERISSFVTEVPEIPAEAEVSVAEQAYLNNSSPVPNCFVCGRNRKHGEGLRVFAGQVPDRSIAASRWVPHENFADAEGRISDRFIWGALDCPSAWALPPGFGDNTLLASMSAETLLPLRAGEKCTVLAWQVGDVSGRKATSASALVNEGGELVAHTRTLWVRVANIS